MYKFNMELSMQPVWRLKETIAKVCRVPVDKQVLLISGGEPLSRDKLVCSYSAGTDTNPIFLFCKSVIEGATPPAPSIYHGSDIDLSSQVEGSLIMPPAFDTVVQRTQLAKQIHEIDAEELKACERLVLDQHLQQQGWAAVVANLEDLVCAFSQRAKLFEREFCQYMNTREDILALLRRIPETLLLLEKIPVLSCLEGPQDIMVSRSQVLLAQSLAQRKAQMTLYSWINTQDPKNRMEDVINNLSTGTTQMNEALEEKVSGEVRDATNYIQAPEMKEVKGLEDRLYGLDQLMSSARKLLEEQRHMAQGFMQNQTRVADLKDNSILPDLCSSHKRQLTQMLSNHRKLRDIKRKCTAAKEELSANLHTRLRWVMYVQRTVNSMDNKLWLYHDNLDRIKTRAGLLRQVETAPQAYASMIVEVVRRRLFSQHYMKWAVEVSQESRRQHKKETQRRKSFTRQYGSHFLQKMFIGFRDAVPKFASEPPKEFDGALPAISQADVSTLGQAVPELKHLLRIPSDTGSPGMASSFQTPLAADGGSEPQALAVNQSVISVTQSVTSTLQSVTGSVSGSLESQDALGVLLFEPSERERMSVSSLERQDERRMSIDDRLTLSIQEQFTVPECLSETLTAEVNSAAMSTITVSAMSSSPQTGEAMGAVGGQQQQLQPEGSGDGQLLSSGDQEPTKSSDSDAVSHESLSDRKKPRSRRRTKAASDTSPDVETSQEFTTADFYIEDSMPSSMTDSPPKPSGSAKDKSKVDSDLAEKIQQVSELNSQVSVLQTKLAASEAQVGRLQSTLNKDLMTLKDSLASMRDIVVSSRTSVPSVVSEVEKSILRVCASLIVEIERGRDEAMTLEKESSRGAMSELESQLEAKNHHIEDLQQGMLKVTHGITDLNKELLQMREFSQKDLISLQEKHDSELAALQAKLAESLENQKTEMVETQKMHHMEMTKIQEQLRGEMLEVQDSHRTELEKRLFEMSDIEEKHRAEIMEKEEKHRAEIEKLLMEIGEIEKKHQAEISDIKEKRRVESAETQEKHCEELAEVGRKNMLEVELETDRIRTEMQVVIDKQEADIARLEEKLHTLQQSLNQVQHEKEVRSEELVRGFASEKQKMSQTLEEEYAANKQREIQQLTDKLQADKQHEVDELRTTLINQHKEEVDRLVTDKQQEVSELRNKLSSEHAQAIEQLCNKNQHTIEELTEKLHSQQKEELEELRKDLQEKMDRICHDLGEVKDAEVKKVHDQLDAEQERYVQELREKLLNEHKAELERLLQESQSKAEETVTQLKSEFDAERDRTKTELQSLQQRRSVADCGIQSENGEVMTLERHCELLAETEKAVMEHHKELVMEAERAMKLKVTLQYQEALEEQRSDFESKMKGMMHQHQKDKDDSMASMKTSLMADRQVKFNEAVTRAVQEKDRIIKELRSKLRALAPQGPDSEGEEESEEHIRKRLANVKEKESHLQHENRRLEAEVGLLQQQLRQYSDQLHAMATSTTPMSQSVMMASMAPLSPSVMTDGPPLVTSHAGGPMEESIARAGDWEQIANMREQRINELESKLMTMSMTASTRKEARDKVSILSCYVGDLVLLCLDDRHDQYVVFTVGSTLHFLHSDSVEALGLKPVEGEARKNWVLAEVTEREYCQARKPQNRFKVPVGTKFYRVKAKPWTPGA